MSRDWYHHVPTVAFDEMVDERGEIRPSWAGLARWLAGLGEHGLGDRRRRADHLLAAFGATHVPPPELLGERNQSGGWHLDPIPFVVGREEWSDLSASIAERARMLATLAGDLSGEGAVVADGIVPAAAVFGDPAFLPLAPRGWAHPMWWYGADLVRTSDGVWRVLRDVTDVVQGIGEALLHRSVTGQALGDVGISPGPAALTGHLDRLRAMVSQAAPGGSVGPRTVVLAPDPDTDTFVATAHLASQLGFHRTSAADLVVRDRRVWLRSLGGLEPVDVVVRGVPAADLDPLVNPRRSRGVAGLVHAERARAVAVVNPVAAALAGGSALSPYVDAAVRHLTGRVPRLSAVPAYSCADPEVAAEVSRDPSGWVLRDTMTGDAVFGDTLANRQAHPADSTDWLGHVRLRPSTIVALRRVDLATVPVVARGNQAVPGAVVLGVSALVDGDRVHVMPGGFARVVEPSRPIVTQRSGWTKDVWVDEPRSGHPALRVRLPQVDLRESLPTQAAEAMFWLGRSAEHAEVLARLVRAAGERLAADPASAADDAGSWSAVVVRLLRASRGRASLGEDGALTEHVAAAISGPGGLRDQLDQVLLAASSVREFLSTTTGRVLADLGEQRRSVRASDAESVERVLVSLGALAGLAQESTVRGPAWRLLDLGRRVERSLAVLGAVEAALVPAPEPGALQAVGETLLAAHETLQAYRRRHRTDVEFTTLVDVLVRDDANPRSVAYQLDRIVEHLASLPAGESERRLAAEAASAALEPLDAGVAGLVLATRGPILELSDRLVHRWFTDPIMPRRLGEGERP